MRIDPEYVEWFNKLLSLAADGQTPVFYGEFWSLPKGFIKVGNQTMPTPPTTMRLISWNIDGIKAHFEALKIEYQTGAGGASGSRIWYSGQQIIDFYRRYAISKGLKRVKPDEKIIPKGHV